MKRIITALFLVPLGVYASLFAPWWILAGIVAAVASLCFVEYSRITGAFAPLGLVAGLLILIAPPAETVLILILAALASMCLPLAASDPEKSVAKSGALVLGILYIFGSWKIALVLPNMNYPRLRHLSAGRHWLMFGLMVNWIGDTGAYYVGRKYGRHKMAPTISPGKSWEGAIASSLTGLVFGLIYLPLTITGTSFFKAGLMAVAANAAGQLGDLAESAVKRGAGVKDSGTMLPGHGGVLDRLDSTMFALPVIYGLLCLLE